MEHKIPAISDVAEACLAELEQSVAAGGQVTDDHLSRMSLLIGKNWAKALQVLDQGPVQCVVADTSGRRIYQVQGKSGSYITLPRNYCSCQAHFYEVVCKSEAAFCKHQLAARLAQATNRCSVTTVPDATLAAILLQS